MTDEDAWAYTPENRALLARALCDIAEGRIYSLGPDDLRALAPVDDTLPAEASEHDKDEA